MITNLNHFSMTVSNIKDSIKFYQDIFDFKLEGIRYNISEDYLRKVIGYDNGILHIAFLKCPGGRIELIEYVEPKGEILDINTNNIGSSHLCFEVSDLLNMYENLLRKNAIFQSEPVLIGSSEGSGLAIRSSPYFACNTWLHFP